mmetsp:Transcript_695/g.1445  ORF Transcript_695/g.1445 Transcript_695/m.1445 type:complete len:740 (-) Transcript_695:74-2293(-)
MFNIYDDGVEEAGYTYFDDPISLAERRSTSEIYLPEELELPVYVPDPESLRDLLGRYSDILAQAPDVRDSQHPSKWKVLGVEVGDDRTDISSSKEASALMLTVQESLLGMLTSPEDTGITCDTWNLAEVTTGTPCARSTMYNYARKRDNFKQLDFIDAPPLRTVIDTTKVERIHSTSYVGKSRILGAKIRSANEVCSAHLAVANLFQDACLATWKGPEPKYLPNTLGGCHCPDAYSDPVNTYLFMKAFRGGGYDRLYGTAVQEVKEAIRLNESGIPTASVIAELLRDDDNYYFATFANFVMIPDIDKFIEEGDRNLPPPLYERVGVRNEVTSVEARLVQAKRLLPKPQAQVEKDKADRILHYIFGFTDIGEHQRVLRDVSRRRRSQISGALRGNTAFVNLANRRGSMGDITRLFKDKWKPCVCGQPEFSMEHANWLSKGAKGKTLCLFDIPTTTDMYVKSEVSVEESLKVGGLQLNVQGSEGYIPQRTVTKVGLYEISSTMEQWCDDKMSELIAKRAEVKRPLRRADLLPIFSKDREWVNDDTLLVEECIESTKHLSSNAVVALVSADRRLANQMSRQANVNVVLIDPASVVKAFPSKTWNSSVGLSPAEVFSKYPKKHPFVLAREPDLVLIDSGSLSSSLSGLEVKEDGLGGKNLYRIDPVSHQHLDDGRRMEVVKRTALYEPSLLSILKVHDPRWKDPYKGSQASFGRDSGSLASYPWSETDSLRFSSRVTRRGRQG